MGGWVVKETGKRVNISNVIPEGQQKLFLNLGSSSNKIHLVSLNHKNIKLKFVFQITKAI